MANLIREKNLPELMIGGHAVTALGHSRATFDLNLLIPQSAADKWKSELSRLSYELYTETSSFLQFAALSNFPLPPINLVLVEDAAFEILSATKNDSERIRAAITSGH